MWRRGRPSARRFPSYARNSVFGLTRKGVSIIAAGGKTVIDTLVQVYQAHEIPTYVIFDNDAGRPQDRDANKVMCRLLGITETETPAPQITANHAVLGGDWETQMKADLEAIDAEQRRHPGPRVRAAPALRRLDPSPRPLPDQLPLEFREGREQCIKSSSLPCPYDRRNR